MSAVLETKGLTKDFAAIRANDAISIALHKGEILGLLGENGAGKSTLMNLLYGLFQPTAGDIYINGVRQRLRSPKDAINAGLGMVHQHFMLVETLTVTENIILGNEPSAWNFIKLREARRETQKLADAYNLQVDPDATIVNLSVGEQQRVEILKALYRKAQILILDEPTAVLTPQETLELFAVIRSLTKSGVSVILITHKLQEIKEISDRVYIMRRGKVVQESATDAITIQELADAMVGRKVKLVGRSIALTTDDDGVKNDDSAPPAPATEVMRIEGAVIQNDRALDAVNGLDMNIHNGEIVGIAGVDGNGQEELAEGIVGLRPLTYGKILYNGEDIARYSIKERINMCIDYVPADRHKYGLVLPFTLSENVVLGSHKKMSYSRRCFLKFDEINAYSADLVQKYDVRPPQIHNQASNLSGGNQQKLILGREFSRNPKVMVIAQPTRGLDIGAIEYIHTQIRRMRACNVAIILISLELEEIFALSDRILVMRKGRIVYAADPGKSTPNEIGRHMLGGAADA